MRLREDNRSPTTLILPKEDFYTLMRDAGPSLTLDCNLLEPSYVSLTVEFVHGPFKGIFVH